MRIILILAGLVWAASSPWVAMLLVIAAVGAATFGVWWLNAMPAVGERFRGSPRENIDPAYVSALESIASEAEAEVERLRAEVERLRASSGQEKDAATASLYRKVGLSPVAPQWLIQAAQKVYRNVLHPDRHPPQFKNEAERRFKAADAIFAEIASRPGR